MKYSRPPPWWSLSLITGTAMRSAHPFCSLSLQNPSLWNTTTAGLSIPQMMDLCTATNIEQLWIWLLHLSSLGLPSLLRLINLDLGLAFPHPFCPTLLPWQPDYAPDLGQISGLYQSTILGSVGFLPLPRSVKLLLVREECGGAGGILHLFPGAASHCAHTCETNTVSLWLTSLPSNSLECTEQKPMGKNLCTYTWNLKHETNETSLRPVVKTSHFQSRVQLPVGELRSHMPCRRAPQKFFFLIKKKIWYKWTYLQNKTDSQTWKTNVWLPQGKAEER